MSEYIIIGDTKDYKDCLVAVCGADKDFARNVLERMLNNPTYNDARLLKGYINLRVQEVPQKDCWWNDMFLVN